jgi:hypothetical protein
MFEKRVIRKIFGQKENEVTGGWKKLCNEELHNFYSSPNIIRMMKMASHVSRTEEIKSAYKILVGNVERNRPLGRPRQRMYDSTISHHISESHYQRKYKDLLLRVGLYSFQCSHLSDYSSVVIVNTACFKTQ